MNHKSYSELINLKVRQNLSYGDFGMLELCHDIWDSEGSFNMVNYNSFTEVKLGPPKLCIPTSLIKIIENHAISLSGEVCQSLLFEQSDCQVTGTSLSPAPP